MGVEKAKLVLAMSSYFQGSHVLKSLPLSEDLRGHDLGGKHDLKRLRHNHINDFSQRGQMGYGGAMSTPPLELLLEELLAVCPSAYGRVGELGS